MTRRVLILWTVLLLATWAGVVAGDAMLVEPRWSSVPVASTHMLLLMAGIALAGLGVIVGLLAMRPSPIPGASRRALLLCLVSLISSIGGTHIGNTIRIAGFHRCGERLRPLVASLREYEALHGAAPGSLRDLGPTAPSAETGLGAYPPVLYETGAGGADVFGNRWMLRLEAFHGTGWDQFIFLPNGRYPESGFGGSIQRVGEWAYVWE
jgi:hypothetical protein